MGKAILLAVTVVVVGASVMLLQSSTNRLQADTRQAARQEEALAREIARSAYNLIVSRARQIEAETPDIGLADLVALVNGTAGKLTGQLNGGSYEAWIYPIGASSYGAVAIGRYGDASHQIGNHRVLRNVLEVDQPSRVKVTFLESVAGYCSAIYLQRFVPKNNNGMGNNPGKCDPSNPAHGSSCETQEDIELRGNTRYVALDPVMIFPSGHNRDNASATSDLILNPGERINFILAVDKKCDYQGRTDIPLEIKRKRKKGEWQVVGYYDYSHPALLESTDDFSQLQEGDYAMIQAHPTRLNVWRIAFEDLVFDTEKLVDVKRWGYGDREWKIRRGAEWGERNGKPSYGGWGWTEVDERGYIRLQDSDGPMPDFNDQVIEVEFIPVPAS